MTLREIGTVTLFLFVPGIPPHDVESSGSS